MSFSQFDLDIDKADYYTRADARLTWLSADTNWTVAAFCNNVFDDIGIRQIEASDESQDYRRGGTLTNPRTYGLELIYKFGAYK